MRERLQIRPNWYGNGPYHESPCIHCGLTLRWTGATSGTTWVPTLMDTLDPNGRPSVWWTCWSNEVERGAFGQHEPFQAIPIKETACPTT